MTMNWNAFITCAVTGSGETAHKSDKVPVTPEQIANSAIEAAKAGAAVVHIHVRDPRTGKGSRSTELYAEVVDRIRSSDTDVVINLTAGMGRLTTEDQSGRIGRQRLGDQEDDQRSKEQRANAQQQSAGIEFENRNFIW